MLALSKEPIHLTFFYVLVSNHSKHPSNQTESPSNHIATTQQPLSNHSATPYHHGTHILFRNVLSLSLSPISGVISYCHHVSAPGINCLALRLVHVLTSPFTQALPHSFSRSLNLYLNSSQPVCCYSGTSCRTEGGADKCDLQTAIMC